MLHKCSLLSLLCLLCCSDPRYVNPIKLKSDFFVHELDLTFPIQFFSDSSCEKPAFELYLDKEQFYAISIKLGQFYVQDGTNQIHGVLVDKDDALYKIDTNEMIDLDEKGYTQDKGIINAVPEGYWTPLEDIDQIRNLLLSLGYGDNPTIIVLKDNKDNAEVAILLYKHDAAYISLDEEFKIAPGSSLSLYIKNKEGMEFHVLLINDDKGKIRLKV